LAEENGLKSIAFSALSTGVYGYPSGEAAEAAVSEVREFLEEGNARNLEAVVFCNFLTKDEDAYHRVLPKYFPSEQVAEDEGGEKALEEKLPEVPKGTPDAGSGSAEPATKKLKKGKEGEDEDEDWEKIEKGDVPHQASVEEAADEEEGGKSKV
jgi:hypothetical protein